MRGGGGVPGVVGVFVVDWTALVVALDDCTTGPPTARADGVLGAAGITLSDVETG